MNQRTGEQIEARHTEGIDLAAARRWARILRRIDRVEFVGAGSYALVHGAAHRLPITHRVPIRAARGLVALGYPATERVAA